MTADPPGSSVTEGVRSLEVRWFFPGQLETAVAEWFGRFPAETESREDTYLLDPQLRGLSVKIRVGSALEVKAYRGSPGILEVAGRACGRMESWQKWSFPITRSATAATTGRLATGTQETANQPVLTGRQAGRGARPGAGPGAGVRGGTHRGPYGWRGLVDAGIRGDGLRPICSAAHLQATAALVFAQALPGSAEPGPDESRSYIEWLRQRPGAKRYADA